MKGIDISMVEIAGLKSSYKRYQIAARVVAEIGLAPRHMYGAPSEHTMSGRLEE